MSVAMLEQVTAALPAGPRAPVVVDVCCGDGAWIEEFERGGSVVIGVDRPRWRLRSSRPDHRSGTPYALPLPDASADVVFARHLLPRLARPHRALAEWLRVLRPCGRLIVLDGFPAPRRRRLAKDRRLSAPHYPQERGAPFRNGLRADETLTLLSLADLWELNSQELGSGCYIVRGRAP